MSTKSHDYRFTVILPYSDRPTQWHPTESTGPFKTLSRGSFKTKEAARKWARENLMPFHAYTIKKFYTGGLQGKGAKKELRRIVKGMRPPPGYTRAPKGYMGGF